MWQGNKYSNVSEFNAIYISEYMIKSRYIHTYNSIFAYALKSPIYTRITILLTHLYVLFILISRDEQNGATWNWNHHQKNYVFFFFCQKNVFKNINKSNLQYVTYYSSRNNTVHQHCDAQQHFQYVFSVSCLAILIPTHSK